MLQNSVASIVLGPLAVNLGYWPLRRCATFEAFSEPATPALSAPSFLASAVSIRLACSDPRRAQPRMRGNCWDGLSISHGPCADEG
jgi:hypothetical protein